MIPVDEALDRITRDLVPVAAETVALSGGAGRVLAADVTARRTQPPVAVSAMDGYAVRAEDVAEVPATLTVIGEAPAGTAFEGLVGPAQAVRIFTGGPLPRGADTIVIQEHVERSDTARITVGESASRGTYVRPAGLDFEAGTVGLRAPRRLTPYDIGLAAAMNVPWLKVRRYPRVALLANGDELAYPGEPLGPNQIVCSNALALAALIGAAGATPIDLGIAPDDAGALAAMAAGARGADLLVTMGGASVGDYDLVRSALDEAGLDLDFWKIAMRPGKPLIFGHIGDTPMLGMPGNPVSALVCGVVFLLPAIARLLGLDDGGLAQTTARLGRDLGKNDRRQDYLRARLERDDDGRLVAMPFTLQDSSVISGLAHADCLVVRPPHAPAARRGETVAILPLDPARVAG